MSSYFANDVHINAFSSKQKHFCYLSEFKHYLNIFILLSFSLFAIDIIMKRIFFH